LEKWKTLGSLGEMTNDMNKFFGGKKILITGHSGFKGSWLTQVLLNWEADITGIALSPNTRPSLFTILDIEKKVRNYFTDIRDFENIKNIFQKEKPEIVFHLAAQPIVRDSYDDPLKTHSTNAIGTANILEAVREIGCAKSVVVITTDKVYENKESAYPYKEDDALGGYDPYSASKAAADIIANSYIRSFFNPKDFGTKHNTLVAIARAGNVIGGGDWANHRLVPDIVRSVYEKKETIAIRSPQAVRPWEHVLEPLAGYLALAEKLYNGEKNISGAWNFGPDEESFVSVEKLVFEGIRILDKGSFEIQPDDSKHEANLLMLDTGKAKTILDWHPKLNFEKNIEFTFEWYKNYYEKIKDPKKFTNEQINSFFN
jgi:CDP-glucose 4,6-dehydratase